MPSPSEPTPCPDCGDLITYNNLPRHRRNKHGYEPQRIYACPSEETDDMTSPFVAESPATENGNGHPEKKGGFLGGMFARKEKATSSPRPRREVKPKKLGRRKSGATLLGTPFELGAQITGGMGLNATARMLAFEAPYAGYVLDEAIAGTMLDRIAVQPLARIEDRIGMVGSVVAPPLIVFQMETHPERIPTMLPFLMRSIRMAAPYIAQGIKKKREADAQLSEVMAELYPDQPQDSDPLVHMVSEIFGMPMGDLMGYAAQAQAARAAQQEEETVDV